MADFHGYGLRSCRSESSSDDDDNDKVAYFSVRWKLDSSLVYRTKPRTNIDEQSTDVLGLWTGSEQPLVKRP